MKFFIREAREAAGLNQTELAKIIGVAPNTLNGYESGKHDPKSELLVKIAQACNVTVDYLLGKEKAPDPIEGDEFLFAMHNAARDLTDDDKQMLLDIVNRLGKKE